MSTGFQPDELKRLRAQLARHPLFSELPGEAARNGAARFELLVLEAGETFITEGAPSDALFVVLAGRCRVHNGDVERDRAGRGAVFGELGLLASSRRSASVTAIRETIVGRLTLEQLDRFAAEVPRVWRCLGMSAGRLAVGRPLGEESGTGATVLALVPVDGFDLEPWLRGMHRVLHGFGPTAAVKRPRTSSTRESIDQIDNAEHNHDFVLMVADPADPEWFARCARQVDRIVLCAHRDAEPARVPPLPPHTATVHLVLAQPADVEHASGTARWLDAVEPETHHHVREGNEDDLARATRLLVERGVGLSLAGGASRAIAHFGVIRAVRERGLVIDALTGSSAGGAVAAFLAMQWDEPQGVEAFRALLACMRPAPFRMTLPVAGIMSGGAPVQTLKRLFGDVQIEDLILPLQIPATDLRSAERYVFRRGPLWRAVRATGSLPFFWPPLMYDDRVLVDAGLVSNQPVDLLLSQCRHGHLIASDLKGSDAGSGPLDGLVPFDELSGWRALWEMWFGESRVPKLADVLIHAMTLTNSAEIGRMERLSRDLPMTWLRLPVDGFGFFSAGERDQAALIAVAKSASAKAFAEPR